MQTIGVYVVKNMVNGKMYVGSSVRCEIRMNRHLNQLILNQHENPYLQNSWNKHGKDNFVLEIVERCSKEERFAREQWWIETHRTHEPETGYNLAYPVKTLVPHPFKSRALREVWIKNPELRDAQRKRVLAQYQDDRIREIRLRSLDIGRVKTNAMWYDPNSKVRLVREANLSKGSLVLAELLKDPVWLASRKTGSRTKDLWKDKSYRDKRLPQLKISQKKGAKAIKQKWDTDPQYREERIGALRKAAEKPEFKKRHKEKLKKFWADPNYRARHSERMKARWAKYRDEKAKKDIV